MLPRMRLRASLSVLATLATLGLAACGGGGDKATGKPQADGTYKKADLAIQANKVCSATKVAAKSIKPITDASDPANVAAYLEGILPLTEKQAAGFAALRPAPDAAKDWNALIAKQQEIVQFFTRVLAKAKAKDKSGQADLAAGQKLGPQFAALAKKLGATTCAH